MEIKDHLVQLAKDKQEKSEKKIDETQIESVNVTHGTGGDTVYFNMKKVGNKKINIPVDIPTEELVRSLFSIITKSENKVAENKEAKKQEEKVTLAKLIIDYITFLANKTKIQFCTSSSNLGIEIVSWLDEDEDITLLNDISKRYGGKKLVAFIDGEIGKYDLVDISENCLKKGDILIFKTSVVATDTDLHTYLSGKVEIENKYPISNDYLEEVKDTFVNNETIYKFANDVVVVLFK